jgi:hypothetical protein
MSNEPTTLGREHFEPKPGHGTAPTTPPVDIKVLKRLFLATRKAWPAREGDSHPDLYLMAPYRLVVAEALMERLEAAERDAERYRWLRAQQWDESDVFVVSGSKTKVRLGTYCPSGELLDSVVDAGMVKEPK